jgi:signal peptidase II
MTDLRTPEINQMAPPRRVDVKALVLFAIVAVIISVVDQSTKILITANLTHGEAVHVLGDVLIFQYVNNPGAAFGLGSGATWVFSIVAIAVLIFVIGFAPRIRSTAWAILFGLLLGGLLGNLIDRLTRQPGFGVGHVVDFVSTPWLIPAIYNVADISIVVSMLLFIILTIRGIGLDGSRAPRDQRKKGVQPE